MCMLYTRSSGLNVRPEGAERAGKRVNSKVSNRDTREEEREPAFETRCTIERNGYLPDDCTADLRLRSIKFHLVEIARSGLGGASSIIKLLVVTE